MQSSNFFKLNWADIGKGLVTAFFGAVLGIVNASYQAGTFNLDFTQIWHGAAAAGVAYLVKNLLTNSDGQFASTEKK